HGRDQAMSAVDETAKPEVLESGDVAAAPGNETMNETTDGAIEGVTPEQYDEADARRNAARWSRARSSPFQFQIPLTGGAPSLAVPRGGGRSPWPSPAPLGAPPPAAPASAPSAPTVPSAPAAPAPTRPAPAASAAPFGAEPISLEPLPAEPALEPAATEPAPLAAPDTPLYPPDSGAEPGQGEYSAETRRDSFAASPLQVQVPLTC